MSTSAEKQLLEKYLDTLAEEIIASFTTEKVTSKAAHVHKNFLSDLVAIRKKMAKSSYNFKEMQRDIEESAGKFLASLNTLSKPHNKPDDQLVTKDLEAIRLGIGKALIKIEKINATAPLSATTNWFVNFCKNLYQNILDLIHKKRLSVTNSAKQEAVSAERQAAIDYLKKSDEPARTQALMLKDENPYVTLFNHSPKKAIELFPEDKKNSDEIAQFLIAHKLDGLQLADYLGEKDNKEILNAYIAKRYDEENGFKDEDFSASIRKFLETFKLPNEGQKIERVMEAFSERYYKQNQNNGKFANQDAAYVLAVAVVMLNTDAHNPRIPANRKMTEAQFINNLRGANDKKDFDPEMLKKIYQDIKKNEIRMSDNTKPPKPKKN